MANGSIYTPVIVGLTAGIVFLVMFAIFVRPQSPEQTFNSSQIISNANSLPEAKEYFAQYPKAVVTYDNTGDSPFIRYEYQRVYDNGTINTAIMSIGIIQITNIPDENRIYFDCGYSDVNSPGAMSLQVVGPSITEILQTTPCAK